MAGCNRGHLPWRRQRRTHRKAARARFHFLTAKRSSVVQMSSTHVGRTADPAVWWNTDDEDGAGTGMNGTCRIHSGNLRAM